MKTLTILAALSALLFGGTGCVCRDGIIVAKPVTLTVPKGDYTFKTVWGTNARTLLPDSSGHLQFETPRMRRSNNMWFGIISQPTSANHKRPFLHVSSNGVEILSLSPEQIWRLPKDESDISILKLK